jgi:hypothetical protein
MYKNIFLFIAIHPNLKFFAIIIKNATSMYHLVIVIASVSNYSLADLHLPWILSEVKNSTSYMGALTDAFRYPTYSMSE